MKIVMIAGNGGSGGLIGYIKGILSADVIPYDTEVTLFCGKDLFKKLSGLKTSINIIQTNFAKERGKDIILNKPLPNELIKMVRNENPDVILFLNGYLRSGLEDIPNVMVLHNQLYIDTYQLLRFGFRKLTFKLLAFRYAIRRSMKKADGVIFLSEFSKKQTDKKNIKYKNGRVIPFGFEDENKAKEIQGNEDFDKIKLIYISALFPYKNHINLIKACNSLKQEGYLFELSIVGQKYPSVYNKLIKEINNNKMENYVVFHDWVEHHEIKSLIDQSNIFIYASSLETTGYGLLEGMARGALIASSDQAGFPDMLKDGGVYFDPQDSISIRDALLSLINMEKMKCKSLQQKALKYAHGYSWDKTAKEHYDYIREIFKLSK